MHRKHQCVWTSLPLSIAVSALCGLLSVAAAGLLFSFVVFALFNDVSLVRYAVYAVLAEGAVSSGFICGKYRRRHGLVLGAVCGFVLYLLLVFAALIAVGSFTCPTKLLVLATSGAFGGVVGVNSKRPRGLRD